LCARNVEIDCRIKSIRFMVDLPTRRASALRAS
jgi:hypothetical protein